MRTKRAVLNTISECFFQLSSIIYGFIITKLIIVTYGSSANGMVASITQLLGQFRIIELGLGGAIIYSLYSPLAESNKMKVNSVASAGKIAYIQVGKYYTLILLILATIYPFVVRTDQISFLSTSTLILIIGSSTCFVFYLLSKYNVLFMASQRNYIINYSRIIYTLINLGLMYLLISNELSLMAVYTSSFIATILQFLFIKLMFKKYFEYVDFDAAPDSSATEKRLDVMVHQISSMITFNTPIILLTLFATLEEVSVYAVYMMIFTGINMFMGVFNNGLVAGFGNLIAQNNRSNLRSIYSQYEYMFYIITSIVFMSAVFLLERFIAIYTTGVEDANYSDSITGMLFVIMGLLNNWKIPQSTIINAAGHFKQTRLRAIIETAISLGAGLLLVFKFGIVGVLSASIIGLIFRSIDIFYVKRILEQKMITTVLRLLRVVLFVSISIALSKSIPSLIQPRNLVEWIFNAIIVVVVCSLTVVSVNFLMEPEQMKKMISRLKKLVFK